MTSRKKESETKVVDLNQYFSTKEASEYLGCTISRVQQMARDGSIKNVLRVGPRKILIHKEEAEFRRLNPAKKGRPRTRKPIEKKNTA